MCWEIDPADTLSMPPRDCFVGGCVVTLDKLAPTTASDTASAEDNTDQPRSRRSSTLFDGP
jgi:hypothetical protein